MPPTPQGVGLRREKLNYFVIQIIRKVYNPVILGLYTHRARGCKDNSMWYRYTSLLFQGIIRPLHSAGRMPV